MKGCNHCGQEISSISSAIGFCLSCIRNHFDEVWPSIERLHAQTRKRFGLPEVPPKDIGGICCNLCLNECKIPMGKKGYCGVRMNKDEKMVELADGGNLCWYYDPLPTNCVADWVCAGGTGEGFPTYSYRKGPEYGYKNLAVFYQACSFNCLYCQNWHFREHASQRSGITAERLADLVDAETSCICYFGGDPTPQILHSIETSMLAMEKNRGRILRICWETNGSMNSSLLEKMVELSLRSGGCIKFDLKAWSEKVHLALCAVSNRTTLDNFAFLAKRIEERPVPPLLIASTLLVPGYIDEEEVAGIAKFIASLNPYIPYALLGFYPHFYMRDLPTTSRMHALKCKAIAEQQGLKNVRIGNVHLLRD